MQLSGRYLEMAFKEGRISVAIKGSHEACIKSLNDPQFLNSVLQNGSDLWFHRQSSSQGLQIISPNAERLIYALQPYARPQSNKYISIRFESSLGLLFQIPTKQQRVPTRKCIEVY